MIEDTEKAKSILLVDGDTSYSVPLRNALTKAGYEVIYWDDGQKALESAKNQKVDMIITEVDLPEISGHTLFNELRSMERSQSIPFIFLSSQKRIDDRIKSMELGVDDYITKPFYAEEIVARVDALFEEIEESNENQSQSEKGFSGSLTEMNLVDLIQTLELGNKSAILKLRHDTSIGLVYIENGEVIDAELDDHPPEQSLLRMFTWNIGSFYVNMTPVNRKRTIHIQNKKLITAAMRRINQWEQVRQGLPALNSVVVKTELNTYEKLNDEEREIITGIKDKKKLYQIIEQSRFDDLKSLAIVKSLYEKGYLEETEENYVTYTDSYLARLKNNASQSKTTGERVASIIANVFKNSGNNGNNTLGEKRVERRQLLDRRQFGRRRDDRISDFNQLHLTKTDLLMIREKLS